MKCISWNVNGIRAVLKKDFIEILYALDADVFCIQETKAQPEQIEIDCEIYPYQYINSAEKKGYSGTMILCKKEPLSIHYGIGKEEHEKVVLSQLNTKTFILWRSIPQMHNQI